MHVGDVVAAAQVQGRGLIAADQIGVAAGEGDGVDMRLESRPTGEAQFARHLRLTTQPGVIALFGIESPGLTGSLAIGGALGTVAILTKQEFLPIINISAYSVVKSC